MKGHKETINARNYFLDLLVLVVVVVGRVLLVIVVVVASCRAAACYVTPIAWRCWLDGFLLSVSVVHVGPFFFRLQSHGEGHHVDGRCPCSGPSLLNSWRLQCPSSCEQDQLPRQSTVEEFPGSCPFRGTESFLSTSYGPDFNRQEAPPCYQWIQFWRVPFIGFIGRF